MANLRNMQMRDLDPSLLRNLSGTCTKACAPKMQRCEMSGLLPLQASLGVTPLRARVGVTLWIWVAYDRASYQNDSGRPASTSMAQTLSKSVRFIRLATLLCWGVSGIVILWVIPHSSRKCWKSFPVYSPPPSVRRYFTCSLVWSSTCGMSAFRCCNASDLLHIPMTNILQDLLSIQVTKYS